MAERNQGRMVSVVTTERLSKKDIHKARAAFWALWTVATTMPLSLGASLLVESIWISPVIVTLTTVFGFNYCEWLLKRRQWKADNTVVLCQCSHPLESHSVTTDTCWYDDANRIRNSKDHKLGCLCLRYTPRFWQMSGRV